MSYGFDLVGLHDGAPYPEDERATAERMRATLEAMPNPSALGPHDPLKQQRKQRLAAALMSRHPTLQLHPRSLGEDALRQFRTVELNESNLRIQILLFDDGAGLSFSFAGEAQACTRALRVAWDCLEIVASGAGYSVFDPQIDKVLDLSSDFPTVLHYACGAG